MTYHLGRLRTRDVELEVRILFPITKKERKLEKEAVVGISKGGQSLGARVTIESAFEALAGADQLLPVLEVIGVRFLCSR